MGRSRFRPENGTGKRRKKRFSLRKPLLSLCLGVSLLTAGAPAGYSYGCKKSTKTCKVVKKVSEPPKKQISKEQIEALFQKVEENRYRVLFYWTLPNTYSHLPWSKAYLKYKYTSWKRGDENRDKPPIVEELKSFLSKKGVFLESRMMEDMEERIWRLNSDQRFHVVLDPMKTVLGNLEALTANGGVYLHARHFTWNRSSETSKEELGAKHLAAHELIHYLSFDIRRYLKKPPKREVIALYRMLIEGFTEYLTKNILERKGLRPVIVTPKGTPVYMLESCIVSDLSEDRSTLNAFVKLFFTKASERSKKRRQLERAFNTVKNRINTVTFEKCDFHNPNFLPKFRKMSIRGLELFRCSWKRCK